jgi:hypothetical protein
MSLLTFDCSGGSHTGSDLKRTGYCGLGTAVRKLGLDTDAALSIDFVVRNFSFQSKQMFLANFEYRPLLLVASL